MAKRINVPVCDRCETPFRSATAFCPGCGGPTAWASHDERVQWEVRQWRASRTAADQNKQQVMLVRTETGYEPMPVARYNEYAWDQPLHPERDAAPEANGATAAPVPSPAPAPVPVAPTVSAAPAVTQIVGPPAPVAPPAPMTPAPDPVPRPSVGSIIVPERPEPVSPATPALPVDAPAARIFALEAPEHVAVSKRAVALGVALVLGLPFGGKIVGLASNGPPLPAPKIAAAPAQPAALVTARAGFDQLGPDAVRYAVVIRNPNKAFQASGVTINVAVHDAKGRLVGRDTEVVTAVPASGATGVAGAVGVSGPAAKITVKVGTSNFQETTPAKPFTVRAVRFGREGGSFVVRAGVSGVEAVDGARVVAVYLDRAGKVVGGDFTYADVPRAPKSATAVISTAGVPRSVARVEVYVAPR